MARFFHALGAALCLALLLALLPGAPARAAEDRHAFGYTKNAVAVYSEISPAKKAGKTLPPYTVVRIAEQGGRFHKLEDGTYVLASDVGLFTVFGAKGKTVYWEQDQTLFATGNPNHPLKGVRLPGGAAVEPLATMVEYYLVQWDGVYGFVPQKDAKEPPKAVPADPVYTVLKADCLLYDLPLQGAESDFRLPGDQGVILSKKAEAFYAMEWGSRLYYLPEDALPFAEPAVKSLHEEGYADAEIPLLDVPDGSLGRVIGQVPRDSVCPMSYRINGYVQVSTGEMTGFADESAFTYPGGNGKDKYYLFLNKATRELTVYRADEAGNSTGEEVFRVVVAIGRVTTPTPTGVFTLHGRERWHAFTLSYAPYAMGYTEGRFIHGPLYFRKAESTIVKTRLSDFGKMATGGCLRTPYEQVRWIYYHCPDGTVLEIVGGVQEETGEAENG